MPVAYKNINAQFEDADARCCLEAGRLATFINWPHDEGRGNKLISKENMAKAGFYYTGRTDCVKCFVCQIKLNQWEPDDIIWDKHIEISPNCLFAKLRKEEGQLTVEEWLDIMCNRDINKLDHYLKKWISK